MTYKILSFCGGGFRGLLSALMLRELDAKFKEETGRKLTDTADMLCGTSTGATITALLGIELTPEELVALYEGPIRAATAIGQTNDPHNPLFPNPRQQIGRLPKQIADRVDMAIREIKKHILFTTFQLGTPARGETPGQTWGPVLFHNLPQSPSADTRLIDAVMASGAMPGLLGTYSIGDLQYVDGAFFNHDPTLAAVAAAVDPLTHMNLKVETVSVINFGTGLMPNWIGSDATCWGAYQWLNGVGGQDDNLPQILSNMAPNQQIPVLNMILNGTSTNSIPYLASMMLGDRYANLNPQLSQYIGEADTSDNAIRVFKEALASLDFSPALAVLKRHWT